MHHSRFQRSLSSLLVIFTIMAFAATLLPVNAAFAQGTMGTVPDPISSRDLDSYADRLQLSRQQRQAVDAMHDQYRDEFEQLRQRDIEKFLNDTRGIGGGMAMLMDRAATQKAFKELQGILGKIKAVDDRFFDQMQTVLTDEQITRLAQVRQSRERVRYRSGLTRLTTFMNPATQVDVGELLVNQKLSPQEQQVIDPLIVQYENSLTSAAKRLHESTSSLLMDALEKIQAQGMDQNAMRDPQRRDQMFQTFRTVMGEVQTKLAEKIADISDLNRKAVRDFSAAMSDDHARALRDQFYQRAYPEIGSGGGSNAARAFGIVLKFSDLTDDQRQTISTIASDFYGAYDRLMEQFMDVVDANRKTQSFFDNDRESRRAREQKVADMRDKRRKLNATYVDSLHAVLTPDMIARVDKRLGEAATKDDEGDQVVITMAGGPGGQFRAVSVSRSSGDAADQITFDPFIPSAINRRDIDGYATRLNLTPEQRAILNSLHTDYLEKYKAIENDQINAVRQAERSLWAMDGRGQMAPPTAEAVQSLSDLRQKAVAAVLALDQSFFDDVKISVVSDENAPLIERLHNARLREVYSRAATQGGPGVMAFGGAQGGRRGPGGGPGGRVGRMFGGESSEAGVDLAAIVESLKPTPSDPAQFNAALAEYEQSAVSVFQKMFEAALRMQAARDKVMAQFAGDRGNADRGARGGNDGFRTMMESEGRAASETRRAVASLNKSTLARLLALLPESSAQDLRRAYYQKAFPAVFQDPRSAQPHLTAALGLDNLTNEQRSQVQEIAIDYRGQYDQISDKLVELEANLPDFTAGPPGGRDPNAWQSIQEQMRQREKLDFDRNDLNDKALARLRSVLNEQQIQQLGGLESSTETARN